jgi:hypothetical protein
MGSGQFDKAGILAADFSGLEAQSPGFAVRYLPYNPVPDMSSRDAWSCETR